MARYDRSELQDWKGYGYRWENSWSAYRKVKPRRDSGWISALIIWLIISAVVLFVFF